MTNGSRMADLEKRFTDLESSLADGPEKQAISVLHAMIQEGIRPEMEGHAGESGVGHENGRFEEIANLYKSAPGMQGTAENEGLQEGTPAPDFSLPDGTGQIVSLQNFRGKNVLLVFYPLDWSPACSDQLSLYQAEQEEFENQNTVVVGVSVDSLYSHGAWAAVRGITFPLLADFHPKGKVAESYQVMRKKDGFSERALYLIDTQGVIRYSFVSPQIDQVPDIYELFENLAVLGSKS